MTPSTEILPEDAFKQLQDSIMAGIPEGFTFGSQFGMPSWFVALEDYPAGYHCQPDQPLPFLSIALRKSHIAMYHMGLYASAELTDWFSDNFLRVTGKKPDMGKSCIRFKKSGEIPFELITELMQKMSSSDWITIYELKFLQKK